MTSELADSDPSSDHSSLHDQPASPILELARSLHLSQEWAKAVDGLAEGWRLGLIKHEASIRGRIEWNGLKIAIERLPGEKRLWQDASGARRSTLMIVPYGFIEAVRGVVLDSAPPATPPVQGADGDGFDCYVGPSPDAEFVYVIDMKDRSERGEDKAILCAADPHEALEIFAAHRDDGLASVRGVLALPLEEFKLELLARFARPGVTSLAVADARDPPEADQGLAHQGLTNKALTDANIFAPTTYFPVSNRAVDGGTTGPDIAFDCPPRPMPPALSSTFGSLDARVSLEAFVARPRRRRVVPRDVYAVNATPPGSRKVLPPTDAAEWRGELGAEARADAPARMAQLQTKVGERYSDAQTPPQALYPKETREAYSKARAEDDRVSSPTSLPARYALPPPDGELGRALALEASDRTLGLMRSVLEAGQRAAFQDLPSIAARATPPAHVPLARTYLRKGEVAFADRPSGRCEVTRVREGQYALVLPSGVKRTVRNLSVARDEALRAETGRWPKSPPALAEFWRVEPPV